MKLTRWKFFTLMFLCSQIAFVSFNAIIWTFYTKQILSNDTEVKVGDLSRIGYITYSAYDRYARVELPKKHIDGNEFDGGKMDLITVGDSYSQSCYAGGNPLYQDYIASKHNLRVLNLRPYKQSWYLETILLLINSGYIKKHGVSYVMLECIERSCIQRLSRDFDFDITLDSNQIESFYRNNVQKVVRPEVNFINTGNVKWVLYQLFYRYSDHAFFSDTYIGSLNSRYFSSSDGNKLLYYCDDVKNIELSTHEAIVKLNNNLNMADKLLRRNNARLYFMPAVDKYNSYFKYLINNRYPASIFFEELRRLPKSYYFVDSKSILGRELDKGSIDIFYGDDTHWSWKGSETIANSIAFEKMKARLSEVDVINTKATN